MLSLEKKTQLILILNIHKIIWEWGQLLVDTNMVCNEISYLTLHLNVTQWFLAIFMEHRLNTAFSVDV